MRIELTNWRTLLLVAGVVIVFQILAFWFLAVAREEEEFAHRNLVWIKKQQDVMNWIKHKPEHDAISMPLPQVIEESASAAGIVLPFEVKAGEKVQIALSGVEFDRLLLWLQSLQQTYGAVVLVLDIANAGAGYVDVTKLVLGRPAQAH